MEKGSEDLYRRLADQHRTLIDYVDKHNNNTQDKISDVYKTIDSRADKLDMKLTEDIRALFIEQRTIREEISRVEKGYKEKINY